MFNLDLIDKLIAVGVVISLFGVKNLLRKKSGTPNVAEPSGAGQPKP